MKEIKLTQGKIALVDDEDFDYLNQFQWCAIKGKRNVFYARRYNKKHRILMHRAILNVAPNMIIDHKDGNGLNNQKSNLRICTNSQNLRNSPIHKDNKSGFKGVYYDNAQPRLKKWVAQIFANNKVNKLGYYKTKEEAAHTYDEAAKKYFGEFARLNFIDNAEQSAFTPPVTDSREAVNL